MNDERHPIVTFVATLGAIAAAVFTSWCTVIAFIGGTMPIIGYEAEGGFFSGIFWVFVVDPIVITVVYWIAMVVVLPFAALASARDAWRDRHR